MGHTYTKIYIFVVYLKFNRSPVFLIAKLGHSSLKAPSFQRNDLSDLTGDFLGSGCLMLQVGKNTKVVSSNLLSFRNEQETNA